MALHLLRSLRYRGSYAIAAMITAPSAAFLVDSFPAKVRYRRCPAYHFATGVRGFLP